MRSAYVRLLVAVVSVLAPNILLAHGELPSPPLPDSPSEWTIEHPLHGAREFAETLETESRGLLTNGHYRLIKEALTYYDWAYHISIGWWSHVTESDAPFFRQEADNRVLEVIENLPGTLELDMRPGKELPDHNEALSYDPTAQTFLIKVIMGDGPVSFRVQKFNAGLERYHPPYLIEISPEGTSYVLLKTRNLPHDLSKIGIALTKEGENKPFHWHALTTDTPLPGQLKISIRNEIGNPTPAFLRIADAETGALWPIEGAYDFHPLIHEVTGPRAMMPINLSIMGPQNSLELSMPGENLGFFWLVDGDIELPVPEGEWKVTVLRGIEYSRIEKTVTMESGNWTTLDVRMSRWSDMAKTGWYSGDDHVHSRLINSEDADTLIALTRAMDVRVSNILTMGDPQRTYYNQRGFGKDFRVERDGYWLIPGMEDPRSILGHNIGLNLTSMARDIDRYLQLDWIAAEVHRQGGLFGQTHVGQNACEAHRGMALMVPHEVYDFYSIMQGGLGTELYYEFLDLGYKLSASAGSDMPYAGTLGDVRVYVHVDPEEEFTPDLWFDGLKAGKTFTTNGPMLEFFVNGAGPGDTILVEDNEPLTVFARAWGAAGTSEPVSLQIVKLGDSLKTIHYDSESKSNELSTTFKVKPGRGFWIAARAWGQDGSAAHTTPVYVQRPGKRHWNPERVEEIVKRQLDILDEIEAVIDGVEKSQKEGHLIPLDFSNVGIFKERMELRALIQSTRLLYQELLELYRSEESK